MNLKLRRPLLGIIGVAAAFGVILGGSSTNRSTTTAYENHGFALKAADSFANETTVKVSSFEGTSGKLDNVVSYASSKGGANTPPAVYSGVLRIYQGSNGKPGGNIAVTTIDGYLIKEVEIGTSMKTSINYTIGDSTNYELGSNYSFSADTTYTVSDLSTDRVTFYCFGSDSKSRLYVNYLRVTYYQDIEIVDDEKATSLSLELGSGSSVLYQGKEFDSTGYIVKLIYTSESNPAYSREQILDPSDERLVWNYDLSSAGESHITVTYTDGDLTLTSNQLPVVVEEYSELYSYQIAANDFSTDDFTHEADGVTWDLYLKTTKNPYIGFESANSNRGLQLGSSKSAVDEASLSSYFVDKNGCSDISSIVVNASVGSSGEAKLHVLLNGEEKDSFDLTTSPTDYTIDGISGFGVVEFLITNERETAVYIKSIEIRCKPDDKGSILVPLAYQLSKFDSCNLATSDFQDFINENSSVINQYADELESLKILDKPSQESSGVKEEYYSFMDKYRFCTAAMPGGANNYLGSGFAVSENGAEYALAGGLLLAAIAGGLGFALYRKKEKTSR